MAVCPLTDKHSAQVFLCEGYDSWTVCLGCPALNPVTVSRWPWKDTVEFFVWARKAFEKEGQERKDAEAILRAAGAADPGVVD